MRLSIAAILGATCVAQQGPLIRTETRTVLVEAVVTGKKGEFVRGLTAKDFHLWQDGKEQAVTSLSSDSQSNSQQHFLVLFFDNTRLAAQDQFQARQAAARFIDAHAGAHDSIAVVSFDGVLRISQNFTGNAGRLKDALTRSEASSKVIAPSTLERQASAAPASSGDLDSRSMIDALGGLARNLGVLPGRKSVVLLSGGTPSSAEMKAAVAQTVEAASRSGVAIYPLDVRQVSEQQDAARPLPGLPRATMPRGRSTGVVAAEDATAAQDPTGASQQSLAELASGTGGFFTTDAGEMLASLQRIGQEQTQYFVLSYTPPDSKEGSCHALKVKVDRAGAAVRARSSYCATPPQDLIAGTAAEKNLEAQAASTGSGDIKASMQLPFFYSPQGAARVHLSLEIALSNLKFENQKGRLHAEVNLLGIATAPDSSVAARFSDTLKLDYATQQELDQAKSAPLHYEKDFKIAPGQYSFTLTFSAGNANFGKLESPLAIEPWNGTDLAVSGVVLSRETRPAADLGLLSSLVQDQTPLVALGTQFVPTGSARFGKAQTGFFYLEAYDAALDSVRVRVRVVDRKTGQAKWDSGETSLPPSSDKGKAAAGAGLRINSLGAGSYRLEISASDGAGKRVERSADFDVD